MAFDFNQKYENFFGDFLKKYEELFRDEMTSLALEKQILYLKEKSEKIANSFYSDLYTSKTILLAGKVQSGKTIAFISVLARMFDKYTNLAIIIGGNDKDLFAQNKKSINDFFEYSTISNNLKIYGYTDKGQLFNIKHDIESGRKVIVVILKNSQIIKQIVNYLTDCGNISTPLIIDDEGDQASFNNINTKEKCGINSPTFDEINNLLNIYTRYHYLTVTATPYAHILVEDNGDFTKPDAAFIWSPGIGYLGIDFFNGQNDYGSTITEINAADVSDLVNSSIVVESLEKAICYFLINATIYNQIYSEKSNFANMLIHFDRKVNKMKELKEEIETFINETLYKVVKDYESPLHKYMTEAINKYNLYIERHMCAEKINRCLVEKNDIINFILSKIPDELYVAIISQKDKNTKKPTETRKLYNIYIGSQMVSRGVRFPHLISSYVVKRSNGKANADYILQMCRWFGYRDQYKYLINLFVSIDLRKDFFSINQCEDQILQMLETCEENNIPFSYLPRSLYLPQENLENNKALIGTRETVSKQKINQKDISNSFYDAHFKESYSYQETNRKIEQIYKILKGKIKNTPFNLNSITKLDNYPSYLINDIGELKHWLGSNISRINNLFGINESINVMEILEKFMGKGKKVIASIMTQNVSDNIDNINFRTRQLRDHYIYGFTKGVTETYVGDRYWYKQSDDYIFIQIHPIKISNIEIITGTDDNLIYKMLLCCNEIAVDIIKSYENNVIAI